MNNQATLQEMLSYSPVPSRFGTSGVRALVKDLTDLEVYCLTLGTLRYLKDIDKLWSTDPHAMGAKIPLGGDLRPSTDRLLRATARAILDAGYDFEGEHKRWFTFGVPRAWDLLSALRALAANGYAHDQRFAPLLDLFLARQDEQGRWLCGSVSRTWPLEKRNRPSKWITLDAVRLLRTVA